MVEEKKVEFYSKRKVSGILNIPDKSNGKAVIMVHGFGGYAFDKPFKDVAEKLCDNGLEVLRFTFNGYDGETNFGDVTIYSEIHNLKTAIDFMENRQNDKIGILAESLGGSIAILLNDKRVDVMFLMAPTIYFKKTFIKSVYEGIIGKKMWKEIDEINMIKESQIKSIKCPIMIAHGSKDDEVDSKQSEELFKMANEPKEFLIIENGKHVLTRSLSSRKKIIQLSLDWFNKWLK
jgi:hypothetical protein